MKLTKETVLNLKGIFAMAVVICHLTPIITTEDGAIRSILASLGYLAVSMFFFMSGYGLYEQYREQGEEYIKGFPQRRIIPFYAVCVATILLYVSRDMIVYKRVDCNVLLKSFFFGETVIDKGWYLQTQLLFYICFWFAFRLMKTRKMSILTGLIILYGITCRILQEPSYVYEVAICFPMGCGVSKYSSKISTLLQSKIKTFFFIIGCVCCFCITFLLGNAVKLQSDTAILFKCLSAVFFDFAVLLCVVFVNINTPLFSFLGKISFEIYIVHGLFIKLFSQQIAIQNRLLCATLVVGMSLVAASLIHPGVLRLKNLVKDRLGR